MRLLLFDIDGTLVHSNGAGIATLVIALEEVFGVAAPFDGIDLAGKTDPSIIAELLAGMSIEGPQVQENLHRVYERMAHNAQSLFPKRQIRPCPGVIRLLDELQQRRDVVLGLVTGNNHLTGPLKLAAAGIAPEMFAVTACGSDDADRNVLPALAMDRARRATGYNYKGTDTAVIGDTPADILCAQNSGASAIAVTTGRFDRAALRLYNPDHIFDDLTDTQRVLDALLGEQIIAG